MNEKDRRRQGRKAKKTSRRRSPSVAAGLQLPSPLATEQVMKAMFGGLESDATFDAQDLVYQAMEAPNAEAALTLAKRALAIDPRCVDAMMMVAQSTSSTDKELLQRVAAAVKAGEENLGADFFSDNAGYFWGILETRPYMRARAQLAQLLAEAGRIEEAIDHYAQMLQLNPNDNHWRRRATCSNGTTRTAAPCSRGHASWNVIFPAMSAARRVRCARREAPIALRKIISPAPNACPRSCQDITASATSTRGSFAAWNWAARGRAIRGRGSG